MGSLSLQMRLERRGGVSLLYIYQNKQNAVIEACRVVITSSGGGVVVVVVMLVSMLTLVL